MQTEYVPSPDEYVYQDVSINIIDYDDQYDGRDYWEDGPDQFFYVN